MWTLMVIRPRAESLRARSIGLSLVGRHPVLPKGGNSYTLSLNRPSRSGARALRDSPLGRS
jgi:hypothetical protein